MSNTTQSAVTAETADSGRIRIGGGARILPTPTLPAPVADTARIRIGGAARPA